MGKDNVKLGDVYPTREGCSVTVMCYINASNIEVRFNDRHSHCTMTNLYNLREGSLKNPYFPSVLGIGYMGVGPYVGSHTVNGVQKRTREYEAWRGMLKRCYYPKTQARQPSYKWCTVEEEWLNFQNFAKWYTKQKGYEEGWDLDKDLLYRNNRIYSKKTCVLIPRKLNALLVKYKHHNSQSLPRGIHLRENCTFRVELGGLIGKRETVSVKTLDEAVRIRNENTNNRIKEVVNAYQDILSKKILDALHKRLRQNLLITKRQTRLLKEVIGQWPHYII